YIMFFFSSRRRHTRSKRDWSSDVCSSDLRIVQDIINYRYNNDKAMIITTELNKNELLDINEATASRLIEMSMTDEGEYYVEFVRSEERRVGKECGSERWRTE